MGKKTEINPTVGKCTEIKKPKDDSENDFLY